MAKIYQCEYCQKPLLHSESYKHHLFVCPKRPGSIQKKPAR